MTRTVMAVEPPSSSSSSVIVVSISSNHGATAVAAATGRGRHVTMTERKRLLEQQCEEFLQANDTLALALECASGVQQQQASISVSATATTNPLAPHCRRPLQCPPMDHVVATTSLQPHLTTTMATTPQSLLLQHIDHSSSRRRGVHPICKSCIAKSSTMPACHW